MNCALVLPHLLTAVAKTIDQHATELTGLDQAIGDGDHVTNLQRGIQALIAQSDALSQLEWQTAFQKMGMIIMSSVGGASGSLYGTLFMSLSKNLTNEPLSLLSFSDAFSNAVVAVKQRGKADKGEKTMLDVLIPVADQLQQLAGNQLVLTTIMSNLKETAVTGAEATRDMIATKGRASFLGERSKGHVDAGAKSSQLMICAILDVLDASI